MVRLARLPPLVVGDLAKRSAIASDAAHLTATLDWVARAHDAGGDGVAARYCLFRGWSGPYPETTGYIIPTLMRYAAVTGQKSWLDRARRMAEWELEVQLPSGAIPGRTGRANEAIVFDTGQVLFGWLSWYRVTLDRRFIDAARRAGAWLVAVQDADGAWRRHEYLGVPHAYQSRVAWSLLALARQLGEDGWVRSAKRNLEWILSQIGSDGWIDRMAFKQGASPFTHTIAYTLEGMWLASAYVDAELADRLRHAVLTAWRELERILASSNFMPGWISEGWRPNGRFVCLTGNAQLASIALRLGGALGDGCQRKQARKLIDAVKGSQRLDMHDPGIRGGVAGSAPHWGPYLPFQYPNWAAKFTADALMDFMVAECGCLDRDLWEQAEG